MNPQQKSDDPVKHVVLLMFENHSFDQMLGCFKAVYPNLDGVDPTNPGVNRANAKEFKQVETTERQMELDPHHEVNHVLAQLADHNGGFVADFAATHAGCTDEDCQFIMGYYPLDFLPALHALARDNLICDHWFSSVPGPTWPNRYFAVTGTSSGKVDMPEDGEHRADINGWFEQAQDTIFDRLSEQGISWKVYFHDIPQTLCLTHQRQPERAARYFPIAQFLKDAAGPDADFPAFCLIEPDYNGVAENDDHPPHDVMRTQKLLADVYNALRANGALWDSTLLAVVYDEHGGFYDHVEPLSKDNSPLAVPPSDPQPDWEYSFDRLGVRVPAVMASPWVNKGFDTTPFDHTSLLKYLIEKWKLGPLGERTAHATSIANLIQHESRNVSFVPIKLSPEQMPKPDLEEYAAEYISGHHKALLLLAVWLQLECLRECPLLYAWVTYIVEIALHSFFKLANSWLMRKVHQVAKANTARLIRQKKQQAIPRLKTIIRDIRRSHAERCHAAETLGLIVKKSFHHAADPIAAADIWLRQTGQ